MSTSGSPEVRRRRLAAELRRLREQSGLKAEAVGNALQWSKAKVSRYELARGGLKPSEVGRLLDVYGVRGNYRSQLLALAEEATKKGWWEEYFDILTEEHLAFIALEAEATSVLQWQINVVPGLLQTSQYAWQIFSGYQDVRALPPTMIERRVQTRVIRQERLTADPRLELAVIIDESVLRRQRGDRAVMREQLRYLAEASELANVTLQVLPLDGPTGLAVDSFQVLTFGRAHETQLHDVVSTEGLRNYLFVEGETDTYEFRRAFEHLAQEALGPEESQDFIVRITRQLWSLSAEVRQIGISARRALESKERIEMSADNLEAADDTDESHPSGRNWRKSSWSMSNGDCIEVATLAGGQVGVRDSKAIADPHLSFSPDAWSVFVGGIRRVPATGRDLIPQRL